MLDGKRLRNLLTHIEGVREGCRRLGLALASRGEEDLALRLIANGEVHDASKFEGEEWRYLNDETWPRPDPDPDGPAFRAAIQHHVTRNLHHPEAWPGGIETMDRLHLAEMTCDWRARSLEQHTNIHDWVNNTAARRFGYPTGGRVHRDILDFLRLLEEA